MSLKVLNQSSDSAKHAYNVACVICHEDKVISGSDDGKVKIWKPNLDLILELEAPGAILSLAVTGNTLYTCTTDQTIQIWDITTGKNTGKVSTTLFAPQKLYIHKDSKLLWAGDSQGNVAKFEDGQEAGKYELVEEIWDIMVANDPAAIYTARDRDVVVAEIQTGSKGARVMVKCTLEGRSPFCVAGNKLCFINREGRVINIHENNPDKRCPKISEIAASDLIINALATGSDNVLFSGGYDSTVKKWDLNSLKCAGSINLNCCVNSLASNSENSVYVARADGVISQVGS